MTFGEHIRGLRHERGLTQRDVAAAAGVDFSYISKLENGRLPHTPSAKTIAVLATALDANELELLQLAGKLPPELARQPEAVAVLRAAGRRIPSAAGWRKLLDYVESQDFEDALRELDQAAEVKR
ncbi:MAG: helix-turn-helix domain-containing protein [Actinomycetota bacterium]|nr:helix-turn-helix domain-containing protein [Actinomycetota bacterium]